MPKSKLPYLLQRTPIYHKFQFTSLKEGMLLLYLFVLFVDLLYKIFIKKLIYKFAENQRIPKC